MQIFRTLAGYTFGRADIIRRAMAKKKHDVLQKERVNFINGCIANGVDEKVANELFDDISDFSSYAFNKAHATAYSIVSYRTAYLKCHYPAYYMAALITSVLDRTSKVVEYFDECYRIGIDILPPDINKSNYNFAEEQGNIRYGLLAIKGVGKVLVENVVFERNENGSFKDIYDFCKRCTSRDLNRRSLEALIKAGCFDGLKYNRREMLENLDNILSNIQRKRFDNVDGQIDFFESINDENISIRHYEEFDKKTLQKFEKEVIGFYLSGHPLNEYNDIVSKNRLDLIKNIISDDEYSDNKKVKVLCYIESIKKKSTKNGEIMAFAEISDVTSSCEAIIFPKIYSVYSGIISPEKPFILSGKISVKDEVSKQIICEKIEFIDEYVSATQSLYIKVNDLESQEYKNSCEQINKHPGNSSVYIFCKDKSKLLKSNKLKCEINDFLIEKLKNILGENNVAIK